MVGCWDVVRECKKSYVLSHDGYLDCIRDKGCSEVLDKYECVVIEKWSLTATSHEDAEVWVYSRLVGYLETSEEIDDVEDFHIYCKKVGKQDD